MFGAIISSRLENYGKYISVNDWVFFLMYGSKIRKELEMKANKDKLQKSPQSIQIIRLKPLITMCFNNFHMAVMALQE